MRTPTAFRLHRVALVLLPLALWLAPAARGQNAPAPWRPVVMTDHGMVVAGHPLACEAGIRILRAGGNAVDAALAAWFVQGLVEPFSTGIGGDLFALVRLADRNEVKCINGTGRAPAAATLDRFKALGAFPEDGPLTVMVPGAVGGAALAAEKYGAKGLAFSLGPAIELAENGYPISDRVGQVLRANAAKLGKFESTKKIWFRDGRPLEAGDRLRQPELARTLRAIAARGAAGFYAGDVARQTARYLAAQGGLVTEADLGAFKANEETPISVRYRGLDVYGCPPNSQGHVMLQALKLLEGYDLKAMGHNSAAYLHVLTEALKLAFADRNAYVGDPQFVPPIPISEMLAEKYADARRTLIDPRRALAGEPPAGDPRRLRAALAEPKYAQPASLSSVVQPFDEDSLLTTTYLAVIDKDRNMVSLTSSLNNPFGSGMTAEGAGYFLNNRMRYFSLDPADVSVLAPGKRVRHTINPQLALKDGRPFLVFGTPGGDTQPQTQLQCFLSVVEFGFNVQQALETSAVVSTSFRASTSPQVVEGKLLVPSALPPKVREELARLGHQLDVRGSRGVGSVKAIAVHPRTGVLLGGVSPAGDNYAVGY